MTTMEKFLVDRKIVSADDLAKAQRFQKETGETLGSALHRMAILEGPVLAKAVSEFHKIPIVTDEDWSAASADRTQIPLDFLRNCKVFPITETDDGIVVAMADPSDEFAWDAIRLATNRQVIPRVAAPEDIESAIERAARSTNAARADEQWNIPSAGDDVTDDVTHLRDLALGTPVVRFVNELFQDTIRSRATDIHIEPFERTLTIRMRVDGMLREISSPPPRMAKAIVSRIKIISGLNIAERRLPQDGRARIRIDSRQLDVRVATMPTIHGEAVAIRLLDNVRRALDLSKLGYRKKDEQRLRAQLTAPYGMIVATGPTGSGKTTTLATALSILNDSERKILTIEDPIEHEIEGINQTQTKPEIGLTFSAALRSFLRHDPDVIMVGEMRDTETAQIGIHAALTGHLVLTSLHTNTAAGAVTRLLDMGVDASLLASSLRCVVGQRLVRTLCVNCRESYKGTPNLPKATLKAVGISRSSLVKLWRAAGCDRCFGTGYRERIAITEILEVDDEIRALIKPGVSAGEIDAAAQKIGMTTMLMDGLEKCLKGLTTQEEIRRVALEI